MSVECKRDGVKLQVRREGNEPLLFIVNTDANLTTGRGVTKIALKVGDDMTERTPPSLCILDSGVVQVFRISGRKGVLLLNLDRETWLHELMLVRIKMDLDGNKFLGFSKTGEEHPFEVASPSTVGSR